MTRHLQADEIDRRRSEGESLNSIELNAMLELSDLARKQLKLRYPSGNLDILCVDSCDIRADRFGSHFENFLGSNVVVLSEHKADESFVRFCWNSHQSVNQPLWVTDIPCSSFVDKR